MKITDLMSKEAIKIHGHASSKMDAIDQMVSLMNKQGNVSDKEAYKEAVIERENLSTTGMVVLRFLMQEQLRLLKQVLPQ